MLALRRLCGGVLTLLVALLLLGLAAEGLGDPAARQLGPEADDAARAALRAELGLDAPFFQRMLLPLWALLHGDLGQSVWLHRPVATLVGEVLPITLRLAALAWPAGLLVGVALGLTLAHARRGWARVPLLLLAMPGFVAAVLAVQVFSAQLGWFPAAGFEGWSSLLLPAALMAGSLGIKLGLILQDRLRALGQEPFVIFAAARGLGGWRMLLAYRLLPAAGLLARFGALHAGYLLGGALVVEVVFGLPGLGRLAVLALTNRDLALLRGCMLAAGTGFLLARFAAEALQLWLDPRPSVAGA